LVQTKVPPYSIDAERSVIGSLMINNNAWDVVSGILVAEDFYKQEHKLFFRAISELAVADKPFDLTLLSDKIVSMQDSKNNYFAMLAEINRETPTAANVSHYADIVKGRSILRRLINVGTQICESAYDTQGKSLDLIVDDAERKVFAIAEREQSHRIQGPRQIAEVMAGSIQRLEELHEHQSPITGLASGFNDFDKLTAGLQPSDLIIVAGRPSMGKTTFALNIAEHVAMHSDKGVLVCSMEMPAEQLAIRMLSSLGRIDMLKLRTGQIQGDSDWSRIISGVELISKRKLYIDDNGALSPMSVRNKARRLIKEHGSLGLIIIDYLQLMRLGTHSTEHRAMEISEISRSLKILARELNVPIIALSQLNRGLESRPDKRPMMSDLRESGAIEQDADLITFIYRDEVYNPESPAKGTAEIIIGKQRNGPIGTVRLAFLGKYSRFDNYAYQAESSGVNVGATTPS